MRRQLPVTLGIFMREAEPTLSFRD